jgi:hypothetical protein
MDVALYHPVSKGTSGKNGGGHRYLLLFPLKFIALLLFPLLGEGTAVSPSPDKRIWRKDVAISPYLSNATIIRMESSSSPPPSVDIFSWTGKGLTISTAPQHKNEDGRAPIPLGTMIRTEVAIPLPTPCNEEEEGRRESSCHPLKQEQCKNPDGHLPIPDIRITKMNVVIYPFHLGRIMRMEVVISLSLSLLPPLYTSMVYSEHVRWVCAGRGLVRVMIRNNVFLDSNKHDLAMRSLHRSFGFISFTCFNKFNSIIHLSGETSPAESKNHKDTKVGVWGNALVANAQNLIHHRWDTFQSYMRKNIMLSTLQARRTDAVNSMIYDTSYARCGKAAAPLGRFFSAHIYIYIYVYTLISLYVYACMNIVW